MKKWKIWFLLILIMAGSSFCFTNPVHAENESNAGVKAAADQFYSALNTLFTGGAGPMEELWSHSNDVTYMGPDGGIRVGWTEVQAVWEKQADKKLGGKITPDKMQIVSDPHMGITYNYETGENIDKDGKPIKVSIRATNVFRNEGGQWKMIGHHTDLLPFLEENAKDQ